MEIISSQPFFNCLLQKSAVPSSASEKKQSSAEPAPSGGTFSCERREPFPYFTIPYFLS